MTDAKAKKEADRRIAELSKEFTLKFTKQDLLVLYNIIIRSEFGGKNDLKIGDAVIALDIARRIEPFVAVETNIPDKEAGIEVN